MMLRMVQNHVIRALRSTECMKHVKKIPIILTQHRFCSSNPTNNIEEWINSFDKPHQSRLQFIQNELALRRVEEREVPRLEDLTIKDYEHIITLSPNQRIKYYRFLYKQHNSRDGTNIKLDIKRRIMEERKAYFDKNGLFEYDIPKDHIEYSLAKNSYLPKIYKRSVDKWRNIRGLWRWMFDDPKIIFDCSYASSMNYRENSDISKQLAHCFGINRLHREPFELHFCGIDKQSVLWSKLHRQIPTLTKKPLPVKIHEADICDVFPKEKLVLLTPDSSTVLQEYNPDDHYVVSGIVDRGSKVPLTLAKAKELNIRTARLPVDLHRTSRVNNVLTLDQVLNVMLEVKRSRDWKKAFQYVPRRKFY